MKELYEELKPIIEKYGFQEVRNAIDEMWDEYEEVEAYEEPYDECGFDPYMGCYSYDC